MPEQVTFPNDWEQPQSRGMVASQTPQGPQSCIVFFRTRLSRKGKKAGASISQKLKRTASDVRNLSCILNKQLMHETKVEKGPHSSKNMRKDTYL